MLSRFFSTLFLLSLFFLFQELSAAPSLSVSMEEKIRSFYKSSPEDKRDILFLFLDKNDPNSVAARRIGKILSPGSPERTSLEKKFRLCILELDNQKKNPENDPACALAEKFGLAGTPSLYLADASWQSYAHFLGGIPAGYDDEKWVELLLSLTGKKSLRDALLEKAKNSSSTEEKNTALIQALSIVPHECVMGCYPDEVSSIISASPLSAEARKLAVEYRKYASSQALKTVLDDWSSPQVATRTTIDSMLKKVNEYLDKPDIPGDQRACILYNYHFPLLVKKSRYLAEDAGRGVLPLESDRLMRMALDDLNLIIKLLPDSGYGKEAVRLKALISTERRKLP